MKRAYAVLDIKAVDDASGIITGIASTPTPDRMEDIVLPQGAIFKLPIPLLWQHNANQPIGQVIEAKVTSAGIEIVAKIARGLTEEIDRAWALIKAELVRGLSIGFRGLDTESIPNSWGVIFTKWEWLELSAVTIPANAEASITSIKKFDTETLAASGRKGAGSSSPGGSGKQPVTKVTSSNLKPNKEGKMKTTNQRITEFQEARKQKSARMKAIMEAAGDETLDAADGDEYDTLSAEVKSLNAQLGRLEDLEAIESGSAKPVGDVKSFEQGAGVRSGVQVKSQPKLAPGIGFARLVKAKGVAYKNREPDYVVAERMYGSESAVTVLLKAAVAAGTSASNNWAGDLVGADTAVYADFAEFLRPKTILGKFGQGNVPSLTKVPFKTPLILGTGGGQGYWVGEGKPKPVTNFDFDRSTLDPLKVANICVLSMENIRDSSPSSDVIVRDQLVKALAGRLDTDFINPAKAASAGVSPASITNGVAVTHASGTDADAVRHDVGVLLKAYITANNPPETGVIIMTSIMAMTIGLMRNSLGQKEFPDINMNGGLLEGIPVITSQFVPAVTAGTYMVMVNAEDIYLGDEGGYTIDVSTEASIEMLDSGLQQDATAGTGTSLVSMFQTNSVAFLAERTINWKKRRASAVAIIDQVAYAT